MLVRYASSPPYSIEEVKSVCLTLTHTAAPVRCEQEMEKA